MADPATANSDATVATKVKLLIALKAMIEEGCKLFIDHAVSLTHMSDTIIAAIQMTFLLALTKQARVQPMEFGEAIECVLFKEYRKALENKLTCYTRAYLVVNQFILASAPATAPMVGPPSLSTESGSAPATTVRSSRLSDDELLEMLNWVIAQKANGLLKDVKSHPSFRSLTAQIAGEVGVQDLESMCLQIISRVHDVIKTEWKGEIHRRLQCISALRIASDFGLNGQSVEIPIEDGLTDFFTDETEAVDFLRLSTEYVAELLFIFAAESDQLTVRRLLAGRQHHIEISKGEIASGDDYNVFWTTMIAAATSASSFDVQDIKVAMGLIFQQREMDVDDSMGDGSDIAAARPHATAVCDGTSARAGQDADTAQAAPAGSSTTNDAHAAGHDVDDGVEVDGKCVGVAFSRFETALTKSYNTQSEGFKTKAPKSMQALDALSTMVSGKLSDLFQSETRPAGMRLQWDPSNAAMLNIWFRPTKGFDFTQPSESLTFFLHGLVTPFAQKDSLPITTFGPHELSVSTHPFLDVTAWHIPCTSDNSAINMRLQQHTFSIELKSGPAKGVHECTAYCLKPTEDFEEELKSATVGDEFQLFRAPCKTATAKKFKVPDVHKTLYDLAKFAVPKKDKKQKGSQPIPGGLDVEPSDAPVGRFDHMLDLTE